MIPIFMSSLPPGNLPRVFLRDGVGPVDLWPGERLDRYDVVYHGEIEP